MLDDWSGRQIGPYLLEDLLGRGGMAIVYRARHHYLERQVALKLIAAHLTDDKTFRTRFQREAALVARLDHPNVVQVYDFGEHEGIPYLAMALINGGSLQDLLNQRGPVPLPQGISFEVLRQVAAGLDHAHDRGLLHRDLKPANVLIRRAEGTLPDLYLLADFGIARAAAETLSGESLSLAGVVGTPMYMSPEQVLGEQLDTRSDVYAFACLAYRLMVGKPPFTGETLTVLHAQAHTPPPDPLEKNPMLDPGISAVLLRGLAKDREERPMRAGELVASLVSAANEPKTLFNPRITATPTGTGTPVEVTGPSGPINTGSQGQGRTGPSLPPVTGPSIPPVTGPSLPSVTGPSFPSAEVRAYTGNSLPGQVGPPLAPPSAPPPRKDEGSKRALLIGGIAAGALLIVGLIVVAVVFANRPLGTAASPTPGGDSTITAPTPGAGGTGPLSTRAAGGGSTAVALETRPLVAYARQDSQTNREIYVMGLDGSNERNLSKFDGFDDDPAFSPSGQATAIGVEVQGLPPNAEFVIHIHSGACEAEGGIIFDLPNLKTDAQGKAATTVTLSKPLNEVANGRTYITIHAEPRLPSPTLTCGNVQPTSEGADSILKGIAGSNSSGKAILRRSGAQKIAFASSRPNPQGKSHIWLMDLDGGNPVQLTRGEGDERNPTWSPDGAKIAFESVDGNKSQIWVINVDGSGLRRLTDHPTANEGRPAWSPDGQRIAFDSDRDSRGLFRLYTMKPDGSDIRPVEGSDTLSGQYASWSPDGQQIAFQSGRQSGTAGATEIWIINADGSKPRQLTKDGKIASYPSWTPDGKGIVYASNREGGDEALWIIQADGSNPKRLTNHPGRDYKPKTGIG